MTALLPSGVVSVSCVQLNGAYAHSIPTFKTFFDELSAAELSEAAPPDDEPHPNNVVAAITPVNINAANLLLLFIIIFSSLIIEIRKGAGVFLQRLCLVRIINLMKQLCNVNFAQFICAFLQ